MVMRSGYSAQTRRVGPPFRASATQHHDRRADVVVRLRDRPRAADAEARGRALGLERRRLQVVEGDEVLLDGAAPAGVDRLADAADDRAAGLLRVRDRP